MGRRGHQSTKIPNVKLRPAPARPPAASSSFASDRLDVAWDRSSKRPRISLPADDNPGRDRDGGEAEDGLGWMEREAEEEYRRDNKDYDVGEVDLALSARPLKHAVVCLTGIKDGKSSLLQKAREMGARTENNLTEDVTHLIAEKPGSEKYRCAVMLGLAIVTPSWITDTHALWVEGEDIDFKQSIETHRLPAFANLRICCTGIETSSTRATLSSAIASAGGVYSPNLDFTVTHLVVASSLRPDAGQSQKVKWVREQVGKRALMARTAAAGRTVHDMWSVRMVWEEWAWDSIRSGGCLDEDKYDISLPEPDRKVFRRLQASRSSALSQSAHVGTSKEDCSDKHSLDQKERRSPIYSPNPEVDDDGYEEERARVRKRADGSSHRASELIGTGPASKGKGRASGGGVAELVDRIIQSSQRGVNQRETLRRGSPVPPSSRLASQGHAARSEVVADSETDEEAIRLLSPVQHEGVPDERSAPSSVTPAPYTRTAPEIANGTRSLLANMSRTHAFSQAPSSSTGPSTARRPSVPLKKAATTAFDDDDDGASESGRQGVRPDGRKRAFAGLRIAHAGFETRQAKQLENALRDNGAKVVSYSHISGKTTSQCDPDNMGKGTEEHGEHVDYVVLPLARSSSSPTVPLGVQAVTEYWVERSLWEERPCCLDESFAFTPSPLTFPLSGAEQLTFSVTSLDEVDKLQVPRALKLLGCRVSDVFKRRGISALLSGAKKEEDRKGLKVEKAMSWGVPVVGTDWLRCALERGELGLPSAEGSVPSSLPSSPAPLERVEPPASWDEQVFPPTQSQSLTWTSQSLSKGSKKPLVLGRQNPSLSQSVSRRRSSAITDFTEASEITPSAGRRVAGARASGRFPAEIPADEPPPLSLPSSSPTNNPTHGGAPAVHTSSAPATPARQDNDASPNKPADAEVDHPTRAAALAPPALRKSSEFLAILRNNRLQAEDNNGGGNGSVFHFYAGGVAAPSSGHRRAPRAPRRSRPSSGSTGSSPPQNRSPSDARASSAFVRKRLLAHPVRSEAGTGDGAFCGLAAFARPMDAALDVAPSAVQNGENGQYETTGLRSEDAATVAEAEASLRITYDDPDGTREKERLLALIGRGRDRAKREREVEEMGPGGLGAEDVAMAGEICFPAKGLIPVGQEEEDDDDKTWPSDGAPSPKKQTSSRITVQLDRRDAHGSPTQT